MFKLWSFLVQDFARNLKIPHKYFMQTTYLLMFVAGWKCLVLEFATGWRRTSCDTAKNAPKMLKPRTHQLWNQPKRSQVQPLALHLPTPATPVATNPSPHPPFATQILPRPAQRNPPKESLLCLLHCLANTRIRRKAQVRKLVQLVVGVTQIKPWLMALQAHPGDQLCMLPLITITTNLVLAIAHISPRLSLHTQLDTAQTLLHLMNPPLVININNMGFFKWFFHAKLMLNNI